MRAFLDEQHRFQARIVASLRVEPETSPWASPETIECNRLLIAALDWISLEICRGVEKEIFIPDVPTAGDCRTELSLRSRGKSHDLVLDELILDPWPFRETSLAVRAEGKRLHGHFSTQEDLLRALEEAEPVRVTAVLHRACP